MFDICTLQVGADPVPVTSAGRLLTAVWWLFALLTVATYTANLAAFLTVKKITPPITSVTDLSKQVMGKTKYWNSLIFMT